MLKKTSLVFLISIICFNANAQTSKINIIPEPVMINEKPGVFTLKDLYSITKDEVKRFIDDMVKYKYNLLHWHLTDDQGWRIEIKSLPKLTSVGAWNVQRTGKFGTFSPPAPDEPRNYGGFYTQNDIKEVVQYAKERFVNILPEVDVPGHSMAA